MKYEGLRSCDLFLVSLTSLPPSAAAPLHRPSRSDGVPLLVLSTMFFSGAGCFRFV